MDRDFLYRIVDEASHLPQQEQRAFVLNECGSNSALAEIILEILEVKDIDDDFLNPGAPYAPPPPNPSLVDRRFGEFVVIEELDRGGMGIVYRGMQVGLGRPVAIKILHPFQKLRPQSLDRFKRESKAASKVQHSHAVPVLSAGETDGIAWYAMPLIEGHDLAKEIQLQREGSTESIWPPFGSSQYISSATKQIANIADALLHMHSLGILHRDIKPSNLLLNNSGELLVTDFGLAKFKEDMTITSESDIQGTPYYMSPEQARAVRNPITNKSDVYSLAVVLYELLSLRRPIDGDTAAKVIQKIASGTYLSLRDANPRTPRDLISICEKGMAYRSIHRYRTAGEFAEDIRRFARLEAVLAKPTPLHRKLYRHARKHRKKTVAGAVVLAILSTAWITSLWQTQRSLIAEWHQGLDAILSESPTDDALRDSGPLFATIGASSPSGRIAVKLKKAKAKIDAIAADRRKEISALLQSAKGEPIAIDNVTYTSPLSLVKLFQGVLLAQKTASQLPHAFQAISHKDLDGIVPTLSVTIALDSDSEALNQPAFLYGQILDPLSEIHGPETWFGKLPIKDLPMSPADWRFTVVVPGIGFGEFDRLIEIERSTYTIDARILSTVDVVQMMTPIPAEGVSFPEYDEHMGQGSEFYATPFFPIKLHDYFIEPAVVSNGQYLAFMKATGARPPSHWPLIVKPCQFTDNWPDLPVTDLENRWLDLPVTGVSTHQMQAYAEYNGMRLPSHFELEYAFRGPDFRPFPWGTDPNPPSTVRINAPNGNIPDHLNRRQAYEVLNSYLLPVQEPGYRHPPFGLYHTYGNVSQATWGPVVHTDGTQLLRIPTQRIVLGLSVLDKSNGFHLAGHQTASVTDSNYSLVRGFRCAKSIEH